MLPEYVREDLQVLRGRVGSLRQMFWPRFGKFNAAELGQSCGL
jgi:hypothetical protein